MNGFYASYIKFKMEKLLSIFKKKPVKTLKQIQTETVITYEPIPMDTNPFEWLLIKVK